MVSFGMCCFSVFFLSNKQCLHCYIPCASFSEKLEETLFTFRLEQNHCLSLALFSIHRDQDAVSPHGTASIKH